jgi:hypothetical protein
VEQTARGRAGLPRLARELLAPMTVVLVAGVVVALLVAGSTAGFQAPGGGRDAAAGAAEMSVAGPTGSSDANVRAWASGRPSPDAWSLPMTGEGPADAALDTSAPVATSGRAVGVTSHRRSPTPAPSGASAPAPTPVLTAASAASAAAPPDPTVEAAAPAKAESENGGESEDDATKGQGRDGSTRQDHGDHAERKQNGESKHDRR